MKKIKFLARVMLVVLLLTSALNFTGCTMLYYNPKNYDHKYHKNDVSTSIMKATVTSNDNLFDKNSMVLDFRYGFYLKNNKNNMKPQDYYPGFDNIENCIFAIYFSKGEYSGVFPNVCYNIDSIEHHIFIKAINFQNAFSEEYSYSNVSILPYSKVIFNHGEKLSVPQDVLDKESGSFVIKLVCFDKNGLYEYHLYKQIQIVLDYKISADGVKIYFDEGVYFK